jgi:predicted Ser/Thr protein kinase/intein/homing endonuclease
MEYFRAAAAGSEVSRRILLLWGPTSSGKSQFAILLKKGLEAFSRTKEGRIFAIDSCPMFENPLNAIPDGARKALKEKYGLIIEGELCPRCAYRLENEYQRDFWKFPVKRIFLSEMNRIGIGTFQPGDTKCIADSLILSESGLQDISGMALENEDPLDQKIVMENGELAPTSRFFRYPEKPVLDIRTNFGYEIRCTPNHPLMTVDTNGKFIWKEAGGLSVGDSLVMAQGQGFGEGCPLPDNPLNIKWTDNFAQFLGLYVSEGFFYKPKFYTMEICNMSPQIQNIVKNAMTEIGLGDKCTVRKCGKGILINSKLLVSILQNWGFATGAHNKTIPPVVLNSGSRYIKQFMLGLWLGDGNIGKHASKNTNEAIYGTVSTELASQVHTVLLTMGIPARKQFDPNIGTKGSYRIVVSGKRVKQLNELLHIPEYKFTRELTENKNNENMILLPEIDGLTKAICKTTRYVSEWHRYTVSQKSYGRRFSPESFDKFIKQAQQNGCAKNLLETAEKLINKRFLYVTIDNISKSMDTVYDIEVPEHHRFIANGFISHNSQSQSELVGSVNFAKLEDFGVESHPLAYNFDGELNVSNRGMMEFIELLKVDPKFRHILLTLAQEKRIKVERFPLIYADLVAISHTNETEFNKFVANKSEEALHDRLWVVKFPYNLQLKEEVKICDKLICHTPGFKEIHIAPHTLHIAAMFAVLSRLEEPKDKGITLLQKMYLYNGEDVEDFSQEDVKNLQKDCVREGLDGVSPRYIVNRLAACFARHGVTYVTPLSALMSIKEGLSTNAKLAKEDVQRLENLISVCISEYDKIACNEVQKAFFVNFESEINNLLANYIDNIGAYLDDNKIENEWGELTEPDEALMRSVEEKVGITSTGKDNFREEVYRKMIRTKTAAGKYDYQSHPTLREALQKQLFAERSDVIRLTVSVRNPDPEALKKINEVVAVLVDQCGYNAESANELLRYVSGIMSRSG